MITNKFLDVLKEKIKGPLFLKGRRDLVGVEIIHNKKHGKFKICYYLNGSSISQTTRKKLKLFRNYGIQCVSCGKLPNLMAKVFSEASGKYNIYFINEDFSILTVDHIIPKSKFKNYKHIFEKNSCVPMCSNCNNEKGNTELWQNYLNFFN